MLDMNILVNFEWDSFLVCIIVGNIFSLDIL